ncbi:MAG: uracil-DNA glycosylase family protein [Candidatus Binatia bacterium]
MDRGHDPKRPTTRRLKDLLHRHLQLEMEDVYATNLFPFIKPGSMSARIPQRDLVRAAVEFALPQIEIVYPRIVVSLGKTAFNTLAIATGHLRAGNLADAIASPFDIGATKVWCQAHPGSIGTNLRNRGGVDRVNDDWNRMAKAYLSDP